MSTTGKISLTINTFKSSDGEPLCAVGFSEHLSCPFLDHGLELKVRVPFCFYLKKDLLLADRSEEHTSELQSH